MCNTRSDAAIPPHKGTNMACAVTQRQVNSKTPIPSCPNRDFKIKIHFCKIFMSQFTKCKMGITPITLM